MKQIHVFLNVSFFLLFSLLIGSCGSDDSDNVAVLPVTPLVTLEGNYSGFWSSTTPSTSFTNLPVTARLNFIAGNTNELTGAFFISNDYTSCCNSGVNDGTITMSLDGKTITAFSYDDIIPNCTGTFKGTGTITDNGTFIIDITGIDCDGAHVGTIRLKK